VSDDPSRTGRVTVYSGALYLTFDTRAARLVHERGNALDPVTDGPVRGRRSGTVHCLAIAMWTASAGETR
jgi:hypothetical protein